MASGDSGVSRFVSDTDQNYMVLTSEDLQNIACAVERLRAEQDDYEMDFIMSDEDGLEGEKLTDIKCTKYPDHKNFLAVRDLTVDQLPEQFQFQGFLDWLKFIAVGTVKLFIPYTSPDRPDFLGFSKLKGTKIVRVGSGYFLGPAGEETFWHVKPCPFTDCPESSQSHEVGLFDVSTAAHVVFDESEAVKTRVEFLFDDDTDMSSVVKARGVSVKATTAGDFSYLTCATHSLDFWDRLQAQWTKPRPELVLPPNSSIAFTITHPHGCEKRITFGELLDVDIVAPPLSFFDNPLLKNILKDMPRPKPVHPPVCRKLTYTAPTCAGSSGGLMMALKKDDSGALQCFSAPHRKKSSGANVSAFGTFMEKKS